VWDHILDFWELPHEPNVLFITYEAMKKVKCHHFQGTSLLMQFTVYRLEVRTLKELAVQVATRTIQALAHIHVS
jgi:hypothetical protein